MNRSSQFPTQMPEPARQPIDTSVSVGQVVDQARHELKKVYDYHRANFAGNCERLREDVEHLVKRVVAAGINAVNAHAGAASWAVNKPVSALREKLHFVEERVVSRLEKALQISPEEKLHKDEVSRFLDEGGPSAH